MLARDQYKINGLVEADGWMSEKVAAALIAIAYNDSFFALEELLGWYGDLVGFNPAVESALTRLAALVVTGDLELIANAVRDALRLQRAYETSTKQSEENSGAGSLRPVPR